MRSCRKIMALLLLLPLLAGCWSRRELNDVALVVAMGIDLTEEDLFEVTFGVPGPGAAGGGRGSQIGESRQTKTVITRRGRSFGEIIREVELTLPRRINLTHTLVVLVGERMAEKGMNTLLDFILRAPEFRLQGKIMLVRGASIVTLLETDPLMEQLQSKALAEIATARIGLDIRLWEYFAARATKHRSAMLPVVELLEHPSRERSGAPPEARLAGAAILHKDRVALYLDAKEVRALKWLRGHARGGMITVPCGEEPGRHTMAFRITQAKQKTQSSLKGTQPTYQVRLQGKLRVSEIQCDRPIWQQPVQDQLVQRAEQEVRELITGVIRKLQAAKTDPLEFGERIRAYHPNLWRQIGQERWGETWGQSQVDIAVDLKLEAVGLTGDPHTYGRPQQY